MKRCSFYRQVCPYIKSLLQIDAGEFIVQRIIKTRVSSSIVSMEVFIRCALNTPDLTKCTLTMGASTLTCCFLGQFRLFFKRVALLILGSAPAGSWVSCPSDMGDSPLVFWSAAHCLLGSSPLHVVQFNMMLLLNIYFRKYCSIQIYYLLCMTLQNFCIYLIAIQLFIFFYFIKTYYIACFLLT